MIRACIASLFLVGATVARGEQRAAPPDEKGVASLAHAKAGPAVGKHADQLQPVALLYGPPPAGIAVSREERIFISFPKWGDDVKFTVGELSRDGKLSPWPDNAATEFRSVQGIAIDKKNRLWLLDAGAARLMAYDIGTQVRSKDWHLTREALRNGSYLNDLCIAQNLGTDGVAFISDSGAGAIIVIDLGTGQAWRRLDKHPSTKADATVKPSVEGAALKSSGNVDGIAIAPDGKTVYYTPFTSHSVYAVDAAALVDRNRTDDDLAPLVRKICDKPSMNDGIACAPDGAIYTTDEEENAIRRIDPQSGEAKILVQDERLLWPDSACVVNGNLYTVTNQLNRLWHSPGGKDERQRPFAVFRVPLNGASGQ